MKTIKETVIEGLKEQPRFRERSRKDRGIATLLKRKYIDIQFIDQEILIAVLRDASSMDRAWRQALQEDPNLRGTDYGDKEILEQEKMLDLGYEPGYPEDIKPKS